MSNRNVVKTLYKSQLMQPVGRIKTRHSVTGSEKAHIDILGINCQVS